MHLRSVAGVFVLSTGLLISIGGGAIATADESGAPAGTQGVDGSSSGSGATTESQPTTEPEAGQGDTGTAGSPGVPTPGQAGADSDPATPPGASDDDYANQWTDAAATDSDVSASDPGVTATDSIPAPPDSTGVASDSNVPASDSNVPAADTSVAASSSNVVAPLTTPPTPLMNVVQPVANAISTVANVMQSVPGRLAALQTSTTPVSDVITSVQEMLTTVAGAVIPLTQLPSNLSALLGVPQTTQSLIGEGGTAAAFTADDSAPLFGPQATQGPLVQQSGTWDGPLFGSMTPPSSLGAFATASLVQQLSLSGTAPLVPEGISPLGARSLFEHVVTAVLVPASLTALAALALPGIGGLLAIAAAGMRVGYRQAKAGLALRVSGIARFAGSGPLGVVRSGSLVALHTRTPRTPRAPRVVRQDASQTVVRHLERVA